jgi:hypothetical protein
MNRPLTLREKQLYHQVHPLKLATDISAAIVCLYFFWMHDLLAGILAMFVPPLVVSAIMVATMDFTWIKASVVGRYLKRSMTPAMEAVRLAGTVPMVLGAWYHIWWLLPLGLAITLFGWLRGLLFPPRSARDNAASR